MFTNWGRRRLEGSTGILTGGVRREGDEFMAGAFVGGVAAVGRTVRLEPGASQELGLIIGTASCLPDTSYVVPPGRYEVVAPVWFNQGGTPTTVRPHLVARGAWITVEAS